ncbi:MAG: S8 family serine peptidase [Desulfobacteraceae bacterium]|nr:S8 family serine peptidase [Desulfobacteraceae bacterium]
MGGTIGHHAYNKVQAWIPTEKIEELAAYPDIRMIQTPFGPGASGTVSEGLSVVGADIWHQRGLTGSGVKVGLVDVGFYGYSSLLGKELPSKVSVRKMGSSSDFLSIEHGAACAEIVYDIVPDAGMYLVNAGDYDVDFHNAVSWLETQKVNVISSSIGINFSTLCELMYEIVYGSRWSSSYYSMQLEYYTQIRDQWNETINQAVAQGITWVQAAGNDGEKRWKSMFTDTDGDGYLNFTPDRNYNEIELPSGFSYGKEVYVLLAWGGDQDSSTDDFNLFITDTSDKIVAQSTISQAEIPEFPMEVCKFTPVPGKKYFAKVQNYKALPQVVTLNIGADSFAKFNICLPSGTVKMNPPADNPNVITAGAVSYTSPNTIETYSSQGPNADDVIKPDFVAPDGVSTSSYGSSGFSGTSAAAPYVAGISALVKQAHPDYTPAQIRSYLERYALDLGDPGKDNVYGSGLVQLPESECISDVR